MEISPSNTQFKNKTVLITGSGRGIGRAIALAFAQNGANIIVNYIHNRESAEETANLIQKTGRKAIIVRANVGKTEDLQKLFGMIDTEFNGLDILIHNAASGFNRPALEQKPSGWDWTMNVNARSLLFATQQAVPLMEKRSGGYIVSISSPGSTRVMPDYIAVGASKAALESLTRYLAVELATRNIRVNAVSPGLVETDALKHFSVLQNHDVISHTAEITPAHRLVTPEDVAGVVLFLCSPQAEMIRGQTLIVDGGYTLITP